MADALWLLTPVAGVLCGFALARVQPIRLARVLAALVLALAADGLSRIALRLARSIARRNSVRR